MQTTVRNDAGEVIAKLCMDCGETKPASEFSRATRSSSGLQSYCRSCAAERAKAHSSSDAARGRRLRRYGISLADYEEMAEEQGGVCACCGDEPNGKGRLHVDHDHETGRVRGLLCFTCNAALGVVENVEQMRLLLDYLDSSTLSLKVT